MAEASGFCYHDISFISWPNHMFEMQKSIGSICSGHPLTWSPLYNAVVRLCQFLVLAGNRFWFYILIVQYNSGVVFVTWSWQEIVIDFMYVFSVQYSCAVVSVFWLWREIVLKMRTRFYNEILLGYFIMIR